MYVKVFSTMLDSSVWNEDKDTKITWVTLLLMADRDGVVRGVPSGIARRANLTVEECRKALKRLAGPDLESSTQEYAGARIEAIEGGYLILNYRKYRDLRDDDSRRAQTRERVRRHRERKRSVTPVTHGNAEKRHAEAEAEAHTDLTTDASRRSDNVQDLVALAVDEDVLPPPHGGTSAASRAGSVVKQWMAAGNDAPACRELILGLGWMRKHGQPVTLLLVHSRNEQGRDGASRARQAYHERRKSEEERPVRRDQYATPADAAPIGDVADDVLRRRRAS